MGPAGAQAKKVPGSRCLRHGVTRETPALAICPGLFIEVQTGERACPA